MSNPKRDITTLLGVSLGLICESRHFPLWAEGIVLVSMIFLLIVISAFAHTLKQVRCLDERASPHPPFGNPP